MRLKKLIASLMLITGIMFPVTKAFAILPLIYLAYAAAAGSSLTPFLIGSSAVIGTTIAVLSFTTPPSTATPTATQSISITLDPSVPLKTPESWTAPAAGSQEPTPPAQSDPNMTVTIPKNIVDGSEHVFTGSSMADVKSQIYAFLAAPYAGFTLDLQYDASAHLMRLYENDPPSTVMNNYINFPANLTCKAGYTPNSAGSACELTDATQVKKPSDGLCEMVSKDGKFTASVNDPDCDSTTANGNGTAKVSTSTTGGRFEITRDSSGNVSIVQKVFDSGTGKTTRAVTNLSTANVATSVETAQTAGDSTGTDDGETGGGTGEGSTNCVGCATESTLQGVSSKLDVSGTVGNHSLPNQPESYYQTSYPNGIAGIWNNFKDDLAQTPFISLLNQMNPNYAGGTCPTWSMDFGALGFGVINFPDLCYIFLIIKGIMILTALFTARAIIFGG